MFNTLKLFFNKVTKYSNIPLFLIFILLYIFIATGPIRAEEPSKKGLSLLEAVQTTLSRDPNILIQKKQIEISKGSLQAAKGKFDLILRSSLSHNRNNVPISDQEKEKQLSSLIQAELNGQEPSEPFIPSQHVSDVTKYKLSVDKQLRWGAKISPGIEISRYKDPNDDGEAINMAGINFTIEMPLLKGRGTKGTAANEMAAEIDLEVNELTLRHTTSQRILNTVCNYWGYLVAKKNLEILKKSEERARTIVNETKILVKAGQRPAAELKQLQANLADKAASRIAAEQRLLEAKQELVLSMGLPFDRIDSLPFPSDEFPDVKEGDLPESSLTQSFIDLAVKQRADLQALKRGQRSVKVLLEAARINSKHPLDLNLKLGYAGVDDGENIGDFFNSINHNRSDMNVFATINYQWPINNNSARGLIVQRESEYQKRVIQTDNLARKISSNVIVAMSSLKSSAEELGKSEESVRLYKIALDNEKKKVKLGMSTLLDVILTEDRLTGSLMNNISNQLSYANALARFRYETGTLMTSKGGEGSISMEELTDVPLVKIDPSTSSGQALED